MNSVTLSNGLAIPQMGLGLWKVNPSIAPDLVVNAIRYGYQHLDCASDYGNESAVGKGIALALNQNLIRRDDLWVTSKLWNTYHRKQNVRLAAERSLQDLQLDYLDLYLIHFPIAQVFVPTNQRYPPGWIFDPSADKPTMKLDRVSLAETWGDMEDLVRSGLVHSIGVSNFSISLLRDMMSYATIPPAVLQVELHPYLTQAKLLRYCNSEGIVVTAFSPLGASSYLPLGMAKTTDSVLDNPVVQNIAARHNKSPAQVTLRWAIQRGTVVVAKLLRLIG